MIRNDKPHGRNLRKGRCSSPGQAYLVTTVTRERRPVFADFYAARQLIETLRIVQRRQSATTLAFVVMPDHLHWLMTLGDGESLSKVMQTVKGSSAIRIGWPIWQAGFHDHAVRADEELKVLARYVVANPLRAGLVEHIGDYSHWDAIWF